MRTIDYAEINEKLPDLINQVTDESEPLLIKSADEKNVVLLSEQDYQGLTETLYLLSHPVNAERLLQAVARPVEEAISWEQVRTELIEE